MSSSFSKRARTSIRISTEQVKTYYLNNTGQWFKDAVQLEATRKWIERTIDEGEDIWVVVGYHTLQDARIMEQSKGQTISGGKLVMPISAALTAAGVIVPFGNLADPGFTGSRADMDDEQGHFIAHGEQICAVQYRRVRHKWFASNKLNKLALAKEARWERYDRPRYLESDGEDIIEVELKDGLVWEGDRDKCELGIDEVFYSATNVGFD
jgi:hypothetical protein